MERLTHRKKDGTVVYLKDNDMIAAVNMSGFDVRQVMEKLADYEDAEVKKTENSVNMVPIGAYNQVSLERNMAMLQLEEHGIPFGGKVDVQAVRHGKWKKTGALTCECSECNHRTVEDGANYCPNCGAKMG